MDIYSIEINWEGPLNIAEVTKNHNKDDYDCGVYQVYGPHILYGSNVLLYIGQTQQQTFSGRFLNHLNDLLADDSLERIMIYLGRLKNEVKYSGKGDWKSWRDDVNYAEDIMIYKYLPSYNSRGKMDYPNFGENKKIILKHMGEKGDLHLVDKAPEDFLKDFV